MTSPVNGRRFDTRRLYLREGCASLFTYCTQVLHLSEGAAYNRIETGRAARRFPEALDALERGASPRDGHTGDPAGRYIPAAVRRAVWIRDEGRCAFLGRSGRCREIGFLEFHHAEPHAVKGPATVDNIQLRCHAHNQHEARLFFGDWAAGPPPDASADSRAP